MFDAERRGRMPQRQHSESRTVLRQLIHCVPMRRAALVLRPRAIVRLRDVALRELPLPGDEPRQQRREHPELRLRVSIDMRNGRDRGSAFGGSDSIHLTDIGPEVGSSRCNRAPSSDRSCTPRSSPGKRCRSMHHSNKRLHPARCTPFGGAAADLDSPRRCQSPTLGSPSSRLARRLGRCRDRTARSRSARLHSRTYSARGTRCLPPRRMREDTPLR